jgi:hypothetical protein
VIACAVPAGGYRVRMSCVVVEFRRLGMFTLGHGLFLSGKRIEHLYLKSSIWLQGALCNRRQDC